jgi:hypothetical protein
VPRSVLERGGFNNTHLSRRSKTLRRLRHRRRVRISSILSNITDNVISFARKRRISQSLGTSQNAKDGTAIAKAKDWQSCLRKGKMSPLSQRLTRYHAVCIRADRAHPILVDYFGFGD